MLDHTTPQPTIHTTPHFIGKPTLHQKMIHILTIMLTEHTPIIIHRHTSTDQGSTGWNYILNKAPRKSQDLEWNNIFRKNLKEKPKSISSIVLLDKM
ncbi:hypothetical protein JHK85_001645 [Glycine max]|uniref:Uncharacterized protein n=1 Tax=Glycine max TaxID=3847 RepID=A0A0R0LA69_SOYBN|nr:hypothetical protein JHK87_001598 [Glycine soja]KAG5069268.1 hypothetical protein JHK85_001645 [Glycine max]KAG5088991.1 hypothetical protein JHK86_001603 [Glycine max]KAH1162878.1 hypothetical protein GYH30_001408 [Glycine max]